MGESSDNAPDRRAYRDALEKLFDQTDVFRDVIVRPDGDTIECVCKNEPYGLLIMVRIRSDATYIQAMTREGIVQHKVIDQGPENARREVRRILRDRIPAYEQ